MPISCINFIFLVSALSVISSGTLICFSGVLSTILAHLTSLNNNMAVLLLIGLNTVDASFYFFFFLFSYLLTILPAYYQISAFNLMTSLHGFLEVSNRYNFHVHAFNLFVLLLLSGFPTALLFTGKIGLLNRFVFSTTFVLFFAFYFLVTFILFLSILALSITVVEPQNQKQVDKHTFSNHGKFVELTFGFFPVCCLVSSILLFFCYLGLFF